ncbi:MAG TPA: hypothetical protein VL084_16010 [Thermoanaerobaculia bacterium]|nr:hypothetical protein [Thermoanaerobaculia bacterium]
MSRSRRFLFPLFLLAIALAVALTSQAAEPSKEVRKTLPLPSGGRVEIDTYKGSVDLVAEERPDVAIEARVTADTECGSAADQAEWVEMTEVRIDTFGKAVRIESDYSRLSAHPHGFLSWCTARPFVAYRIRMPKKADLELKDYKSKVNVTGLSGDLRLESYKGTMTVRELDGSIRLETYKGEAAVSFAGLRGDSRFETYKGSIEVSLPKTAAFELDADAGRRGDFRSEFGSPLRTTGRLRSSLNGGGPRLALSTYKGTLKLAAR